LPLTQFSSESEYLEGVKEGERPDIEIIDTLKEDHSSLEDDLAIMDSLVSVMTRCWHQNPDARPNMIVIRDKLSDLLNQQSPQAIQRSVAAALKTWSFFFLLNVPRTRFHFVNSIRSLELSIKVRMKNQ